jgi:hypothetical protein
MMCVDLLDDDDGLEEEATTPPIAWAAGEWGICEGREEKATVRDLQRCGLWHIFNGVWWLVKAPFAFVGLSHTNGKR